jgi:hypothetical protein
MGLMVATTLGSDATVVDVIKANSRLTHKTEAFII